MSSYSRDLLPAPKSRPELRVHHDAEDQSVNSKSQIIESNGGLRAERMASSILSADNWRIQEHSRANGIAAEAKDVQKRKIWRKSLRSLALEVENYLGIE